MGCALDVIRVAEPTFGGRGKGRPIQMLNHLDWHVVVGEVYATGFLVDAGGGIGAYLFLYFFSFLFLSFFSP